MKIRFPKKTAKRNSLTKPVKHTPLHIGLLHSGHQKSSAESPKVLILLQPIPPSAYRWLPTAFASLLCRQFTTWAIK